MFDRRWCWAVLGAIGVYFVFGLLLIAQKPGLQYDEALLVAGGVHLQHPYTDFPLGHERHTWVCKLGYCFPLMAEGRYIGAIKEYICWPLFALIGPRAWLIRLVSMVLGAIGIWGISKFVGEQVSHTAGVAVALTLAIHPAYLNMTTFDNGAVGAMMAGLGLVCAALAYYLEHPGIAGAFWVGAAAGFGVWTRANFVWMLIAGVAAALLVFGRRALIPYQHLRAVVVGGIVGGFPFLLYQVVSGAGTWRAVSIFVARQPMRELLSARMFMLADTLLSDGEHRRMWGMEALPDWQLWLFAIAAVVGCAVCLLTLIGAGRRKWSVAQFAALAFLFLIALLFSSRLQIAEHHLIAVIPLAAVVVVLAFDVLQAKFRKAWILAACFGAIYAGSALYWEFTVMQNLRSTGGVGVWSDAVLNVAKKLDQQYSGRNVRILDWGLQMNLYVLTNGRLNSQELHWDPQTEPNGGPPRPWMDLIREGGLFLMPGPENRNFPAATEQFLRTLDSARPVIHRDTFAQRSGATYAQIVDVEPNSIRGSAPREDTIGANLSMNDPHAETQLSGFYGLEEGSWRWTKSEFSVLMNVPDAGSGKIGISVQVYVPESSIRTLGPLTLRGRVGSVTLAPMTFSSPGAFSYTRDLPAEGIDSGVNRFEFQVDKHLGPSAADGRELGIIVNSVSLEAK